MDIAPPPKRRRTSSQGSDYSPRPASRDRRDERDGSRKRYTGSRSRSRSGDERRSTLRDRDPRRPSYRNACSPSAEYTPQSRSRRPSYSPRSSQSPPSSRRKAKLDFLPLFSLRHAHARGITCAKFSPDGALLATASADASINIYAVPDSPTPDIAFKLLRTLRSHKAGINALSWSPIGPPYTLASASDDKSILLWTPLSSDFPIQPSPLIGHSNYVYSLAFSPKGNMLVTGSYDEAVFLWDVRSARVMRQLPAHSDPVSGVDFVRDGTMVCSCASDGLIRIWDAGTGQCLKTLVDEDRKAVTAVRFSPNGRYVLAWTLDSSIRLWRYLGTDGGGCVKTYQGHKNTQYSLGGTIGEYDAVDDETSMTKREAFVASGSEDGDVFVWDINTKDILWRGSGHRDVVLSIDWARVKDGRGLLVSVGRDRELRVWIEDTEAKPVVDGEAMQKEDVDIQGHMVQLEIKREDTEMDGV
ncbi:WD domain protein [Knufia fluminis]|uniref:WD domain protein n=1 Tax=Knufia fluminis TaxID=191047 RepID=A0AAN8I3D6_9EURO|nr:WD domain protein [Knufia fluminis]